MEDYNDLIEDDDIPEFNENTITTNGEDEGIDLIQSFDSYDELSISEDDLNSLEERASDIDRSEVNESQISFGRKMCPTRGGCQGATDCDYSYGSYPE